MTQPPHSSGAGDEPEQPSYPQQPAQPQQPQGPYGTPPAPYGQAAQTPYGQVPYGQPYGQPPAAQPYGGGGQPPYGTPGGLPQYSGAHGHGTYQEPGAGLAGRFARLVAGIIDLLVLAVVSFIISLPFGEVIRTDSDNNVGVSGSGILGTLIEVVISITYYAVLHANWNGQTLGKKALGLRLVRADDLGPVSMGSALARSAIYNLAPFLCCVGGLVNVGWILFDDRRQALHDKAVRTVVVTVRPGDPDPYARSRRSA
jgi:uncharacterized RDD family membrane protein YckC